MDLPKKKLMDTTGRNTTWGVFKAYVVFFLMILYRNLELTSGQLVLQRVLFEKDSSDFQVNSSFKVRS